MHWISITLTSRSPFQIWSYLLRTRLIDLLRIYNKSLLFHLVTHDIFESVCHHWSSGIAAVCLGSVFAVCFWLLYLLHWLPNRLSLTIPASNRSVLKFLMSNNFVMLLFLLNFAAIRVHFVCVFSTRRHSPTHHLINNLIFLFSHLRLWKFWFLLCKDFVLIHIETGAFGDAAVVSVVNLLLFIISRYIFHKFSFRSISHYLRGKRTDCLTICASSIWFLANPWFLLFLLDGFLWIIYAWKYWLIPLCFKM